MSETDGDGWTTGTLRAYVIDLLNDKDRRYEQRFQAQESALQTALVTAEKAVLKAESSSDKRFDSVNEFRQALADQTASFVTRDVVDALLKSHNDKLDTLTHRLDLVEGRSGGISAAIIMALSVGGVVGALVSAAALLLAHK